MIDERPIGKFVLVYFMAMVLLVTLGLVRCSSTPTTPTAGCENSVLYKHKNVLDVALPAAVIGLHVMQAYQPQYYVLAHAAAQQAAALLASKPVSLQEMTNDKIIILLTPLLGLIPVDQILDKCDRDYLIAYLLMV
jgi:hypothetical protein